MGDTVSNGNGSSITYAHNNSNNINGNYGHYGSNGIHSNGNGDAAQAHALTLKRRDGAAALPASIRFRTTNMLFVANLPFHTPWQSIKDHFRQAGNVRYTDLIADQAGRPKGSALVTMETAAEAANAIRMFNETDFDGRRLIVRKFDDGPRPTMVRRDMMPRSTATHQRRAAAAAAAAAAAGMPRSPPMPTISADGASGVLPPFAVGQYNAHMSCGGVANGNSNNGNGGGGGYGSVDGVDKGAMPAGTYASTTPHDRHTFFMGNGVNGDADEIGGNSHLHHLQQQQQQQQQQMQQCMGGGGGGMYAYAATPQHQQQHANDAGMHEVNLDALPKPRSRQVSEVGRRLFVSNLPFDCTCIALRETFQQVGNVERAEILYLQDGRSRGMGIVVMATETDARVAIAEFDGIEMANRAMHVRLDNKHA